MPSWRDAYRKVIGEINSPDGSLGRVADLVAEDPILTGRILKTVNSAVFGFRNRVVDPKHAVLLLGGERLKSILIFTVVLSISDYNQCRGFNPERFWKRCVRCGELARRIMRSRTSDPDQVGQAFTAGLVQDIGQLLMAINLPEEYSRVLDSIEGNETLLQQAEYRHLEVSHTELGAKILESWDLPCSVLEAVLWHHNSELVPTGDFRPLTAAFVADALLAEQPANPDNHLYLQTEHYRKAIAMFGDSQVEEWLPSATENSVFPLER